MKYRDSDRTERYIYIYYINIYRRREKDNEEQMRSKYIPGI